MGGRCFIDEYVNLPITRDTLNFFICVYKNNDNDNFKKDTPSYLEYSLIDTSMSEIFIVHSMNLGENNKFKVNIHLNVYQEYDHS